MHTKHINSTNSQKLTEHTNGHKITDTHYMNNSHLVLINSRLIRDVADIPQSASSSSPDTSGKGVLAYIHHTGGQILWSFIPPLTLSSSHPFIVLVSTHLAYHSHNLQARHSPPYLNKTSFPSPDDDHIF